MWLYYSLYPVSENKITQMNVLGHDRELLARWEDCGVLCGFVRLFFSPVPPESRPCNMRLLLLTRTNRCCLLLCMRLSAATAFIPHWITAASGNQRNLPKHYKFKVPFFPQVQGFKAKIDWNERKWKSQPGNACRGEVNIVRGAAGTAEGDKEGESSEQQTSAKSWSARKSLRWLKNPKEKGIGCKCSWPFHSHC